MFTSGMADMAIKVFSLLTFLVAIPSAVKVFNWLSTMYKGSITLETPMLYALAFIFLFSVGGLTGLMQGAIATDVALHDTSFIVAHFHYTMFGGGGVMFFACLHFYFPKMFGRMYGRLASKVAFVLFFLGFNTLYFPLFIAGYLGQPRRVADYLPEYEIWHKISTVGSWIMVTGILIMFANLAWSLFMGKRAPANPWRAATLEWTVPSPPPEFQFPTIPTVTKGPYDFEDDDETRGRGET